MWLPEMFASEKVCGVGSGASWLDQEGAQGGGSWESSACLTERLCTQAMFGMLSTWSCPSHGYPDVHMYNCSYWNVRGH